MFECVCLNVCVCMCLHVCVYGFACVCMCTYVYEDMSGCACGSNYINGGLRVFHCNSKGHTKNYYNTSQSKTCPDKVFVWTFPLLYRQMQTRACT